MTAVTSVELGDVQALPDERGVALDEVGVCGVSVPICVGGPDATLQASVAHADLSVALPAGERGTHMSRFVEELVRLERVTPGSVADLAGSVRARLGALASSAQLSFPLFVVRSAPETELSAPHRYDVWLRAASRSAPQRSSVHVGVRAAVTSLCPCSREISDYGAHSQRGYVEVEVSSPGWLAGEGVWPQEVFGFADTAGSAQIYPLLKRPDERLVTMRAYDNPAFVEDIARDVVLAVRADRRCEEWVVSVVNHESIHDHQAIARVRGSR